MTGAKTLRVIVSGALANKPFNGGNAWVILSWLRGLRRLGCDVCFVEQVTNPADAAGNPTRFEDSNQRAFFDEVMAQYGLAERSAVIYDDGAQTHGMTMSELCEAAHDADLLINISGHLTHKPLTRTIRRKVYLDLDPGYTQFWHVGGHDGARLSGHDLYYTVGENIGTDACSIPTGGVAWRTVRQPVVLDDWRVAEAKDHAPFTTIASWRGAYGRVEFKSHSFGVKAHEFRKFIDLPRRAAARFQIALDIHPGDGRDRTALMEHGWALIEPQRAAGTPDAFRRYVQSARAEFSAAQGIYVETNSGWFSDRTVRYLASGKPVLVQDTGFTRHLPCGQGLLAFRAIDDAVRGVEQIEREYSAHCAAARHIAQEYFESDKVLTAFLEQVL